MIIKESNGGGSSGKKTVWDKIVDFVTGIFKPIKLPTFGETGSQTTDKTESEYYKNKDKKYEASNSAIDYITSLAKPKTFDEWLGEQGLSRKDTDENYFGSFYKKNAKSLSEQAYSDKFLKETQIKQNAEQAGAQSHNSYRQASSNFSGNSEHMFQNGLNKSGFSNYLGGLTYLAYRGEITKNRLNKSNSLLDSENQYQKTVSNIKDTTAKNIKDRENELYNLYLKELETNKKLYAGLK